MFLSGVLLEFENKFISEVHTWVDDNNKSQKSYAKSLAENKNCISYKAQGQNNSSRNCRLASYFLLTPSYLPGICKSFYLYAYLIVDINSML